MAAPLPTSTRRVLRCLLDVDEERPAEDVGRAAGLPSGTAYPVLAALELDGWVSSRWEEQAQDAVVRPARRVYRLTEEGRARGWNALQRSAR